MQLIVISLMKRVQGREMGLLYSSYMCDVQKLPSTKNCGFPLAEAPLPYSKLKGISSPC